MKEMIILQFTLKVIGHMIMSLEPTGEEQEKFRSNFKIISSCFASLPFKIPGTAFYRGIKVKFDLVLSKTKVKDISFMMNSINSA